MEILYSESRRTFRAPQLLQRSFEKWRDEGKGSKISILRIEDEEQGDVIIALWFNKWEGLSYEGKWRKSEDGKFTRRNSINRI